MRRAVNVLAAVSMIAVTSWASISEAAFFSFPRALKFQVEQIRNSSTDLFESGFGVSYLDFRQYLSDVKSNLLIIG